MNNLIPWRITTLRNQREYVNARKPLGDDDDDGHRGTITLTMRNNELLHPQQGRRRRRRAPEKVS